MVDTIKETIKVTGLSCGHCVAAVEKAVRKVKGVSEAKVDLASGTLSVEYDPGQAMFTDIAKAVTDAGYGVG
ncbi:copper ion binding protein [Dehalogenimonas sp. THU2]|uniref:heavy-metal-associated domain-containing protein n=1 Tax=Dehalogenimonas sp. THU2 TaxID=3151121 RepID=UPI0032189E14